MSLAGENVILLSYLLLGNVISATFYALKLLFTHSEFDCLISYILFDVESLSLWLRGF